MKGFVRGSLIRTIVPPRGIPFFGWEVVRKPHVNFTVLSGKTQSHHTILRQHVPNSGAEYGVSGLRKLLGALARALGVLHLAHWS